MPPPDFPRARRRRQETTKTVTPISARVPIALPTKTGTTARSRGESGCLAPRAGLALGSGVVSDETKYVSIDVGMLDVGVERDVLVRESWSKIVLVTTYPSMSDPVIAASVSVTSSVASTASYNMAFRAFKKRVLARYGTAYFLLGSTRAVECDDGVIDVVYAGLEVEEGRGKEQAKEVRARKRLTRRNMVSTKMCRKCDIGTNQVDIA